MAGTSKSWFSSGWVIDSGANQHMVASEQGLENIVDISHLKLQVDHLNGTTTNINKIGDFRITGNVIIYDVLVVLGYAVNLLSVYKLSRDSKLYIGFDENGCYIQDLPQKNIMGKILVTGSVKGGLYFF